MALNIVTCRSHAEPPWLRTEAAREAAVRIDGPCRPAAARALAGALAAVALTRVAIALLVASLAAVLQHAALSVQRSSHVPAAALDARQALPEHTWVDAAAS